MKNLFRGPPGVGAGRFSGPTYSSPPAGGMGIALLDSWIGPSNILLCANYLKKGQFYGSKKRAILWV